MAEAARVIAEAVDPDANIISGMVIDEDMTDEMKVTVIATGFDTARATAPRVEIPNLGSRRRSQEPTPSTYESAPAPRMEREGEARYAEPRHGEAHHAHAGHADPVYAEPRHEPAPMEDRHGEPRGAEGHPAEPVAEPPPLRSSLFRDRDDPPAQPLQHAEPEPSPAVEPEPEPEPEQEAETQEEIPYFRRALAESQPDDPGGYGPNWSNVDDYDIPTVLRKQMD